MSILLKDILIITPEGEKTGNVCIDKDKIVSVGEVPENFSADTIIDGSNKAVIPGLINAHSHSPMVMMRSFADALPLQEWLFDKIFPIEDNFTDEAYYYGSHLAMAEMLRGGITCFNDMYMGSVPIIKAATENGICINIQRALSNNGEDNFEKDHRVIESRHIIKEYHGYDNNRIMVDIAPHAVYTCSPQCLSHAASLATEYGVGMHVHLSETLTENSDCIAKYGKTPTQLMLDCGVFDVRTSAAHCVHLSDDDRAILKEKDVTVVNCPSSNLKLGSGIIEMEKLIDANINVALGSDGAASNNNLDMFEEMHIASILYNGYYKNPALVNPKFVFDMATKNGAKALGRGENTGKIEEGYFADLAILDIHKPHLYPRHNMLSNMVYSAQSSDVETTIVRGKILYNKGEYTTIDIEKIIFETSRIAQQLCK